MSLASWRSNLPVLVADAQAIGSVAVIRSLGQAGYPVHAASADPSAIGLRSRYLHRALIPPPYSDRGFVPWLREAVRAAGLRAIVPSEGFLHAIRDVFQEFSHLLPLPRGKEAVFSAMSKCDVYDALHGSDALEHLPPSRLLSRGDRIPTPEECDGLGYPLFAKVDALHADAGGDNAVRPFETYEAMSHGVRDLLSKYRRVLLQGYVPGVGGGAFLLRWNGEELAHFMHRRIHEVPHTGGASSYRAAWFHQAVLDDARRRLTQLDWQGVAMLEYRWDPATDRFWLIELNARFWGSLHLALFAGVDFPRLLLDAFFGRAEKVARYDRAIASRLTFPREMEYVLSCLKDARLPTRKRLWPVVEFFLLGMQPGVRSDLWYPGDRRLYLASIWAAFRKFLTPG
jgi:hypothetical protein